MLTPNRLYLIRDTASQRRVDEICKNLTRFPASWPSGPESAKIDLANIRELSQAIGRDGVYDSVYGPKIVYGPLSACSRVVGAI
jgi:hypothetical protein